MSFVHWCHKVSPVLCSVTFLFTLCTSLSVANYLSPPSGVTMPMASSSCAGRLTTASTRRETASPTTRGGAAVTVLAAPSSTTRRKASSSAPLQTKRWVGTGRDGVGVTSRFKASLHKIEHCYFLQLVALWVQPDSTIDSHDVLP